MEHFYHIDSSKKPLYDSYKTLPTSTKNVYAALQLIEEDRDTNVRASPFMPTNRQISELSLVNKNSISHHLAVLDRNGYIWVTWGYIDSLHIRKHQIEFLNKKIA